MAQLELDYFDDTEFFDKIFMENNLSAAQMLAATISKTANSIDEIYIIYLDGIKSYIKNLGYDFKITLGHTHTWTTIFLEGKSSDLTHFKLRHL